MTERGGVYPCEKCGGPIEYRPRKGEYFFEPAPGGRFLFWHRDCTPKAWAEFPVTLRRKQADDE